MRQFVQAPASGPLRPSLVTRIFDGITRAIDAALNRVFALTHRASITRWRVLVVGFLIAWLVSIVAVIPELLTGAQPGGYLEALQKMVFVEPKTQQEFVLALLNLFFVVFLHPAVIKHLLALIAPFWLMHHITAVYLADIFEEPESTARLFVMEAAFGRGYTTIHIRQGVVAEQDQASTIIRIGGPGYVQVDLDSAVLFERPDGTPHVIGPTSSEIIDDFERIRRVVDLRDSVDTIDLPPTRSKDGIIVGAKDIQYSYSLHRGEAPDRSQMPYPFSRTAFESLVYKDNRTVKPGIAPPRTPEWQSSQFKMGGPIMGEMGGFISKRGLSEFLAAIGEPEENSLKNREQKIDQSSQRLSGINGNLDGEPILKAGPFSPRTDLTNLFYEQQGFQERMLKKGFTLNWIGVGTWHTPAEIIPANYRDAWRISRENFSRGNLQALETVKTEATLQELLRLIQTLPVGHFYKNFDQDLPDDEKLLDDLLQEYEETLQRAADLYLRGQSALDLRFTQLTQEAVRLFERISRPADPIYDMFLQNVAAMSNEGYYIFDPDVEEILRQAAELYENLKSFLETEDQEFLLAAVRLYNDLKVYNQILRVISAISVIRRSQYRVG